MPLTRKQKIHAQKQANKWLRFKHKVEGPFKRELKPYFFQQSKIIARGGDPETIAPVLDKHYKRIVREMTGIKLKQDQDNYGLEDALVLLLFNRGLTQSMFIDKTTRKLLRRAVEIARQDLFDDGIMFPSQSTLNKTTANIFRALNRGRISSIATTETQMLTEKINNITDGIADDMMNDAIFNSDIELGRRAAELSESLTFEGVADNIGEIPPPDLFALIKIMEKTWVTVGDNKVRITHDKANWQTVPVSEPFIVGGFMLMYPGDSSMGAPMKEISGCRCHPVNL